MVKGRVLSHTDVAARGGLSRYKVLLYSTLDRWDSIPIRDAFAYAAGCGLRLWMLRSDVYIKLNRKGYCGAIKRARGRQRRMLGRLLA